MYILEFQPWDNQGHDPILFTSTEDPEPADFGDQVLFTHVEAPEAIGTHDSSYGVRSLYAGVDGSIRQAGVIWEVVE